MRITLCMCVWVSGRCGRTRARKHVYNLSTYISGYVSAPLDICLNFAFVVMCVHACVCTLVCALYTHASAYIHIYRHQFHTRPPNRRSLLHRRALISSYGDGVDDGGNDAPARIRSVMYFTFTYSAYIHTQHRISIYMFRNTFSVARPSRARSFCASVRRTRYLSQHFSNN